MEYPIPEKKHTINGVPGRMHPVHAPWMARGRLVHCLQKWISEPRPVDGYGTNGQMYVEMAFDDHCENGYQSFYIVAEVFTDESRRHGDISAGGCMHDEIAEVFPELTPFIKWHHCSTDGPLHYIANTVYLAGDRDYYGLRKGKTRELEWARNSAIWPDATDEQLCVEPEELKAALLERLPALMAEFRADMENAGFLWEPETEEMAG